MQLFPTFIACAAALLRDAETRPLVPAWSIALAQLPALAIWLHTRCGWLGFRKQSAIKQDTSLPALVLIAGAALAAYRRSIDPWTVIVAVYLGGSAFAEWASRWHDSIEANMDRPREVLARIRLPWVCWLVILIIVLSLPLSTKSSVPDYRHNFLHHVLNCALASTSSACLMGISPYSFSEDFSLFGQSLLILTTQAVGMALAAAGLSIARPFLARRLTLKTIWLWMIGLQVVATAALSPAWFSDDATSTPARIGWSIVYASDAIWNAGYTLRTNGLADYLTNPLIFTVITTLAIIGSLGMPIVLDLILPRRQQETTSAWKPWKRLPNWEAGVAFALLLGIATLLFLFETRGFLPDNVAPSRPFDLGSSQVPMREVTDHAPRWRMAVFLSATLRSAGIQSIPLVEGAISWPSYAVMLAGMLIGGTAMGVAGGFRTTALVLGAICLFHPRRMWNDAENAVRRRTLRRLILLVATDLLIAVSGILLMCLTTAGTAHEWIFDPVAAVSSVGLTTSLSLHLTWIGRLVMIGLMIVGLWVPLIVWSKIAADFASLPNTPLPRAHKP